MSNKRFLASVLTTEPPLDPQEHVDAELWKQWRSREMGRQRNEYEHRQYEEFLNQCRMQDALEDSLIEREGR
jgi:hypothetical protein